MCFVIRKMGVQKILSGSSFAVAESELALEAIMEVDWNKAPCDVFVFFDFAGDRFLRIPGCDWPYSVACPSPVPPGPAARQPGPSYPAPRRAVLDPYAARERPQVDNPYERS